MNKKLEAIQKWKYIKIVSLVTNKQRNKGKEEAFSMSG